MLNLIAKVLVNLVHSICCQIFVLHLELRSRIIVAHTKCQNSSVCKLQLKFVSEDKWHHTFNSIVFI